MGAAPGDGRRAISEEGEEKEHTAGGTPAPCKFAVLLCAEESEYVKRTHGSYLQVFVGLLGEEGETWHVYRAAKGELPRDEDVDGYDGFVVIGSCCDAHGEERWIQELHAFLRALVAKRKKILSRALGGKTGTAAKGWDIGMTCIHPSPSTVKLFSPLRIPTHLPVIECHQDAVWQLPARAEVMACSEKTGIDMFRCGDHMMGIQGHPEYNKGILMHLVDRLLQNNLIQLS